MAPWRAIFGWIAIVPLLAALLAPRNVEHPRALRRAALAGWVSGIAWYILNSYWIYQTMHFYGGVPPLGSAGILVLYSLILGLYCGLFSLAIAFLRRRSGDVKLPVLAAPFLWVGIDLLASRITSVPWDQLGYSQVDNFWLTHLAPVTGTYGITFVILFVNALFAAAIAKRCWKAAIAGGLAAGILQIGSWMPPKPAPVEATAVLLQENLKVATVNLWPGAEWDTNVARFLRESETTSNPFYEGLVETGLPLQAADPNPQKISLIAWPEAPSPFRDYDPRFRSLARALTTSTGAVLVAGNISADQGVDAQGQSSLKEYNSATVFSAEGDRVGRYDKIHLVPFGEYVPYRNLLFFAHHLTQALGDFDRGTERKVFTLDGKRYGVFICYEAVFGAEVREFAKNGAQVFVNISDDGWYGDTSAPWQHLNMARMRAIENRRWILRDTNTGVTASIDPYGRVVRSAPRHVFTSLAAPYGFRSDVTFYSEYGDVFPLACLVVSIGIVGMSIRRRSVA
ncbi:apolipoprotein N-acyltransferase [Silvibacterium acidisoli]|uniref:apolipoprotein N-acyltransferase n=1 Tax=Acidobacteriaceae bacterium ZG23-2 TaxID=2883246 RepID=UPI00406C60C8